MSRLSMNAACLWLDMLSFGDGHGMAAPYAEQNFYWMSGRMYRASPGLGAQLYSTQWTHPKAGERCWLRGYEFVVFRSSRSPRFPFRVEVAWSLIDKPGVTIAGLLADLAKSPSMCVRSGRERP